MFLAMPIGIGEKSYKINQSYVLYITGAGYSPLLITPKNNIMEIVQVADGLVLPGGIDIDPMHYGESNWGSFYCNPDKDRFERELFWAFVVAGKPVFGICRGFQLAMREYLYHAGDTKLTSTGKRQVDDIMGFEQDIDHHEMTGRLGLFRTSPHHFINANTKVLYGLNEASKIESIPINSMHHQAVYFDVPADRMEKIQKITPHVRVLGWTRRGLDEEQEGVICEAACIEGWSDAPIMGVQWHPEELKDFALLHAFFGKQNAIEQPKSGAASK